MVEYVWGLHNFSPEQDDEIDFRANERILVLEKDDVYQDGWWKGTNQSGKTGLFPQGYTTSVPPQSSNILMSASTSRIVSGGTLDALPEDEEPESSPDDARNGALLRAQQNAILQQSSTSSSPQAPASSSPPLNELAAQGTVLHATMTDIQEAIEQLGAHPDADVDTLSRSFSFASTKEGITTDEDEAAEKHQDRYSSDWNKDARKMLAHNASKQPESEMPTRTSQLLHPPPIDVELSDESEDEGPSSRGRSPPPIPHAITTLDDSAMTAFPSTAAESPIPITPVPAWNGRTHSRHESESTIASPAPRKLQPAEHNFLHQSSREVLASVPEPEVFTAKISRPASVEATKPAAAVPIPSSPSPQPQMMFRPTSPPAVAAPSSPPIPAPVPSPPPVIEPRAISPAPIPMPIAAVMAQASSRSVTSSPSRPTSATAVADAYAYSPLSTQFDSGLPTGKIPSEWNVDEVVAWLRSKRFDEQIVSKFIEHEISGDVLVELDQNMLKEVDITAFGKRVKLAHAISELRRPPSFISARSGGMPMTARSASHSIASGAEAGLWSPESAPHSGDILGTPIIASLPEVVAHVTSNGKTRPASLTIPPLEDSVAQAIFTANSASSAGEPPISAEALTEETETESPIAKKSPVNARAPARAHGGSISSLHSISNTVNTGTDTRRESRDSSLGKVSPGGTLREKEKKSALSGLKSDRSDGSSSRHSFFGGTLGGKSRKPAPRYSETQETVENATKPSRSLSRLYLSSSTSSKKPRNSGSTPPSSTLFSESKASPPEKEVPTARDMTGVAASSPLSPSRPTNGDPLRLLPNVSVVEQIGPTDREGWMRKKGERYNTWKLRYFVLKGPHLYYLRSKTETKIKGYINIKGYRIMADENANPGRYGFRIFHETGVTHWFSSDEQVTIREWMKALMKATIGRDYTKPVMSSVNIPTIPLHVAQAMSPAPRPPSPTARDATQRALRRDNPNQLSSRDARVLMGLPSDQDPNSNSNFNPSYGNQTNGSGPLSPGRSTFSNELPSRPTRDSSRLEHKRRNLSIENAQDQELIGWINQRIPHSSHKATDMSSSLATGLVLYRLAESIKTGGGHDMGYRRDGPEVPDSVFPATPNDDKLDGLFILFDFLLDNDVRMGNVTINDVRSGDRDQLVVLVKALKAWEEKRKSLEASISFNTASVGPFMA